MSASYLVLPQSPVIPVNRDFNTRSLIVLRICSVSAIMLREKAMMSKTVLEFEPEKALFTLTEDPLIFYKRIASAMEFQKYKRKAYFEINPIYAEEIIDIFKSFNPTLSKDMQQKILIFL